MRSLLDIFIDLLPEFDLPEPEINHTVIAGENQYTFLLAFPRDHLAIREGGAREVATFAGWQVWECEDEARARIVCREIARALQIEPSVLRLDFSRVKSLLESRQLDMARDELEGLQGRITRDHPDWSDCEKYRKSIRRARRQQSSGETQTTETEVAEINSSFPQLLRQDGARINKGDLPPFCILGLFSPLDESMSTVDAVWVASVSDMGIDVWPACLEGNPAYEADPSWETVETEVELLQGVLTRIEGRSTFVWDLPKVQLLLQNWHYRARGSGLPDGCKIMGLQELSQVAFPTAHRTDSSEALCKQLKFEFRDEMGNGGPLAAMVMLVGRCVQVLSALPDEQRAALRAVFSLSPGGSKLENLQLFGDERGAMPGLPLQDAWLDVFLPPAKVQGEQGYLEMLLAYYQQLNPPVRQSKGQRGVINLETLDFLKKGGFIEQVTSYPYRVRENQVAFSQMIEDALEDKRPYVLEAGTGIGKTIGYLIPALLSGKHTYISTHTKSLQDQAWSKDVPLVIKALEAAGIERKVSILKGKGNYVCLQTVADLLENPQEFINSKHDIFFVAALLNWLLVTKTGWLGEIEHFGNLRLLKLLGRDQAAPKLQDKWADADPHTKAKEAAAKSDLVVTNHSYVFSVANTIEPEKSVIETLILDEAHNVEDVVTEVLTLHFRPWALLRVIDSVLKRDSKGEVQGIYRILLKHPQVQEISVLKAFGKNIQLVEKELSQWCVDARDRLCDLFANIREIDPDLPVPFVLDDFWVAPFYESTKTLLILLKELALDIHNLLEKEGSIKGLSRRLSGSLGSLEEQLKENVEALEGLFEKKADRVHWGEASVRIDANGDPVLEAGRWAWTAEFYDTPLDIAAWLRERVNPAFKHRCYLSATMSMDGNFDTIIQLLGLDNEDEAQKAVTGIYPSPFDYKKQALLGVPHDMPLADPRLRVDPLYMESQCKHLAELARVNQG